MLTTSSFSQSHRSRDSITNAYRMDETECLNKLIPEATLPADRRHQIKTMAEQLALTARENTHQSSLIDTLLKQYHLSSEEGIALMSLAEALLRISDKATMDKFIADKIATIEWQNSNDSFFSRITTWSFILTGKIYAPTLNDHKSILNNLKRASSRLGMAMIRPFILQAMKMLGEKFVLGQDIHAALINANQLEPLGYRFSYDMLGEAARTDADAKQYYLAYVNAITAIGKVAASDHPSKNPGISIKLSALHPRYEYSNRECILQELPPLLLALAQQAKKYRLGLTVDAEEADRLDLSLDIFAQVFADPSLADWDGLGLAVQAYQKRAYYVIDWLAELAKQHQKRIMVRLVKGAYWDAEIKTSQIQGFSGYPVFTRKSATDVSYIACAKKLLANPSAFYPQFGTHNAYSVATIFEIADPNQEFEFQCLQGMGRPLYNQIVSSTSLQRPCRIYAPVGTHKDLLAYLVRRLLENGANSSFVNHLANTHIPIEKIITDPVARLIALPHKPHPQIPLPDDIYPGRKNSRGIDLSNANEWTDLKKQTEAFRQKIWQATSIVNGHSKTEAKGEPIYAPAHQTDLIGYVSKATDAEMTLALQTAHDAAFAWAKTPVSERAIILEHAADLFQQAMPELITLLNREGGKCIPDCISEIRETIDYCRYYAIRAQHDLAPQTLPGPTGEANQLTLHPRGVIACISPWNFPLAIFCGQILAALAAGNCVIAKPAEQTPLIAYQAIQILHQAGIPKAALQLLIGDGNTVGARLVNDPQIDGVMFTGSTETARFIQQALANRPGPIVPLIAETGGQNAMIVDSTALPEQAVIDIVQSAFNSAGQRCSALRILFVQEEIAPTLLTMLKGCMAKLTIGNPNLLATDIGPVIDQDALKMLKVHFSLLSQEATLIAKAPMQESLPGYYFAPCAFELKDLSLLKGEVFGPILHVIRYKAADLDNIMDELIRTGYGLTLGIQSRIDATIKHIIDRMPIGNIYVNRNIIGAVVGVQPFGGERLSGTGPKAGGPHYLPRLCVERAVTSNTTAVGGNARLVSLLEED